MNRGVLLSIDPGAVNMGVAVWDFKNVYMMDEKRGPMEQLCPSPIRVFTLESDQRDHVLSSLSLVDQLDTNIGTMWVREIVVEKMEFRSTSLGVAAINDVMDVVFTCGALAWWAARKKSPVNMAPVSEWKGQLPKATVVSRILKRWQRRFPDVPDTTHKLLKMSDPKKPSHDWDAVGIGLWRLGYFG